MDKRFMHDDHQRQLALDTTQSFIIQAPAGSGKTELLIQRFLKLLNQVQRPEEIIALTFTKKAANEMRERIIRALTDVDNGETSNNSHQQLTYALAKQALARDHLLAWNLLTNPNQLRIQTIDSLCSLITNQLPILSTFGAQPRITDYPQFIYREVVQEILSHLEENFAWSQDIAKLLLHLDNDLNKLHELLVKLIAKRDQWLPYIKLHSNDLGIKYHLESNLKIVIQSGLNILIKQFPKHLISELLNIVRYAASNLTHSESNILHCLDLVDFPDSNPENLKIWRGIANVLLTNDYSWRQRFSKEVGFPTLSHLKNSAELSIHKEFKQRTITLMNALVDHDELRVALKNLFYLPEPSYSDRQWEILQSLLHILKLVSAQLRVSFQKYNTIDFIENAQAAIYALGSEDQPTDLALSLDYKIQHILVDEFQDTSITQYRLLEKLVTGWQSSDSRTLFVVGDPMQSIYRFREAEVGLFIRMREHGIGNIKLIPLLLSVNFRSNKTIVQWINEQFKKILPSYNDIESGAISYSASIANKEATSTTAITIKGLLNGDDIHQAEYIINSIKAIQNNHPDEKIAILARARSHLSAIISTLKSANIAYQAVDIDPLISRQPIQDLLTLTCSLLHLADRISWLSLLRAPWCGLTLEDIYIISGDHAHSILWEQLQNSDIIEQLSEDGKIRLTRIIPILKTSLANRGRSNLREWIESTWILLGGPALLENYHDINDINTYFNVLDEFSQNDLLQSLDKFKEKIKIEFSSPRNDHRLQLMTIHTAKGLEFDTVIIPHIERKILPDDKPILTWMEKPIAENQIALFLAAHHGIGEKDNAIYKYIYEQHKIKSDFELSRLFYVATTRAKNNLYLFFNIEKNTKDEYKLEPGSFLEKLWPMIKHQQENIIDTSCTITSTIENNLPNRSRVIQRLVSSWKNPIVDKSEKLYLHQQNDGFRIINQTPKIIGTLVHTILQRISQLGINWWQSRNSFEKKQYLHRQVKCYGIMISDIEFAIDRAYISIDNMLQDQRGLWILQPHQHAKSELPLTAIINGSKENLIIDRTFIDEHDTRWIIDYKTSTLTQQDLSEFLAKEQEKYLAKMQQYAKAMQLFEAQPIKLGLYFPALSAWHEWEYVSLSN